MNGANQEYERHENGVKERNGAEAESYGSDRSRRSGDEYGGGFV